MSRIDTLLAAMTLEEKLGQLTMTASSYAVTGPIIAGDSTESIKNGHIGNLLNMVGAEHINEMQQIAVKQSRLKIPLLVGLDVIHGHHTLFPIPIAEAGTFDPQLWERTAHEAAVETAAAGLAMTFAPMLDVSRDPRWGRTAEGPGEEPLLGVLMARAKVKGFQGADLGDAGSVAACAKHFCAYGPVTAGREYASVDISERTLHEVHLPPFESAVAAGVATIMPSFTDIAGIPMTANKALLRDYLRDRLGFDGVIVSDYNAIGELLKHGVAADVPEAAALALKAGVDIDMMTDGYRRGLPVALDRGLVTMADIDAAVRRVLRLKERLGLFEDPYRRGAKKESAAAIAARRAIARDAGARAITMFRNERETLPFTKAVKRIALIGPLADNASEMRGPWGAAGTAENHVSVLAGFKASLPGVEVSHLSGVTIDGDDRMPAAPSATTLQGIESAVKLCDDADAIVLCVGEAANMSGEAASRAYLDLPGQQRALVEAVIERAHALGKRVTTILFSGRPLVIPWLAEETDALLAAWFLGAESGNAIADVLSGRVSPSGRTPMSWPRAVGQIPIFFASRPGGRPFDPKDHFTSKYMDVPNDPLYPFGFGLTYGRIAYSKLLVTPEDVREPDTIHIQVDVTNEGKHAAEETVFVFTRDRVASVSRPVLELKGFGKARVKPGERTTVTISFPASALKFLGADLKPVYEPGDVDVFVGPCADRERLLRASIRQKV